MLSQEGQWVRIAQPETWTLRPNSAFILSCESRGITTHEGHHASTLYSQLNQGLIQDADIFCGYYCNSHPRKTIVVEIHCVGILKYTGKYIYKYLAIIALLFNEGLERLRKDHCFDFTKKVSFRKACVWVCHRE